MPRYYNKQELKEQLDIEQVFEIVDGFGGEPEYTDFGFISQTICHNLPGEGSRKLYYYENDGVGIFHCYSGSCDSFDIFELIIKCMDIQRHQTYELWDAMDYVARRFGLETSTPEEERVVLEDWNVLKRYELKPSLLIEDKEQKIYDESILSKFINARILDWELEGINYDSCLKYGIKYYPGEEQIIIPHYDINNNLVGIRTRELIKEKADRFGKYKPLRLNKEQYNHPLSLNLYGINHNFNNIKQLKTAIIFESEKAVLQYESYYESNIAVACCGSNISNYQFNLLKSLGIRELIIGFDKQFKEISDKEFDDWVKKLTKINTKFGKEIKITFLFDKYNMFQYKSSPIDEGKEKFEFLLNNRFSV